ncbi:MAG: GNAT family N-acetyltransferase [Microcoleaceae cyanobacterium]
MDLGVRDALHPQPLYSTNMQNAVSMSAFCPKMSIRESNHDELDEICCLHENAFSEPEGKVIAQLICNIFNDETAKPLLSLVAETNDEIAGHILFSSVMIKDSRHLSVYILAPLAVSKNYQRQGWGTRLIHHGLDVLKARATDIVLVLGDPEYYNRAGFQAGHNIAAPHPLKYPEAWMALELKPGVLAQAQGVAQCAVSLSAPEYW